MTSDQRSRSEKNHAKAAIAAANKSGPFSTVLEKMGESARPGAAPDAEAAQSLPMGSRAICEGICDAAGCGTTERERIADIAIFTFILLRF